VDSQVLLWIGLIVLVIGVGLGLAPWSQSARSPGSVPLGAGVIGQRRKTGLMHGIVIAQIAVAVLLVGASGLMLRSLQQLSSVDPGFHADNVLTFHLAMSGAEMNSQLSAARFAALRARLADVPGVVAVGATLQLPLSGLDVDLTQLEVVGAAPVAPEHEPSVRLHVITPAYLTTLGVPLLQGRDFTDADQSTTHGVAIVNEAMARRLWSNQTPIGKRVSQRLLLTPGEDPTRTVVGVVGNVKHFGPQFADEPQMYVPHAQSPWPEMNFVVRSPIDVPHLVPSLRAAVADVDPGMPLDRVRMMPDIVAAAMGEPRFRTGIVTVYATACVFLAFLGLYAVLAHSVSQRTREIGLRLAMGATSRDILRMVLSEGARFAAAGALAGFLGLFGTAQLINALLFGVSVLEPAVLLGSSALCVLCTALACAVPAYRAARVDPVIALRSE
jgi:putative ABC transport system permease protein